MSDETKKFTARLDALSSVTGIRAVAPGGELQGGHQQAETVTAESVAAPADAEAFEKAGWTFVKAAPDNADVGHGVVVDADGHMKILSDALNVKFDPALSQGEVTNILASHDLSIRRNMGFAPNLYVVSGSGGDALTNAKSLNALESVVYAEPVMIEPITGR